MAAALCRSTISSSNTLSLVCNRGSSTLLPMSVLEMARSVGGSTLSFSTLCVITLSLMFVPDMVRSVGGSTLHVITLSLMYIPEMVQYDQLAVDLCRLVAVVLCYYSYSDVYIQYKVAIKLC